ncbi:MAG: acyltransferase [Methylovirgula sp.]
MLNKIETSKRQTSPITDQGKSFDRKDRKDMPLEAVRGLAAFSVVFWHSMYAFFPRWTGAFPEYWPMSVSLRGEIWFGLIQGIAAVSFFFVLSAFVLTRRYFLTRDPDIIIRGAVKRWPRLAGPVIVAVLFSLLLFKTGAYHFKGAGAETHSSWLATFGWAVPFTPHFWDAFSLGAFFTFFRGDIYYDTSLWTMKIELIGSFMAYGLALLIAPLLGQRRYVALFMIIMSLLLCYYTAPWYVAFPIGVGIAAFLPTRETMTLPVWSVIALLLIAIYFLGYSGVAIGAFVLPAKIFSCDPMYLHLFGSILIILAIELAPDSIRNRLSGRIARGLGKISFPLYLVHVLVLFSLGSAALLWTKTWWTDGARVPSVVGEATTIVGATLVAIPLAYFNEYWTKLVNRIVNRLMARTPTTEDPLASG